MKKNKNKNFQIFIGIALIIVLLFLVVIFAINYYTQQKQKIIHEENIREELISFRKYKEEQTTRDVERIIQTIKKQADNKYSDYNHYIEKPDAIIKSIEAGYCMEEEDLLFFKGEREKKCTNYGENSVECLRLTKCKKERYAQEAMYKLIEEHAMLEADEIKIDRSKRIYDEYPNWDLYSIILAGQNSINMRMLKESSLYVWGEPDLEKVEDGFEAVWYWKKICGKSGKIFCDGSSVEGYKRDLLVFNRSDVLFYFLLDR